MRSLFVLEISEFLDSCLLKYDLKKKCFYLSNSSLLIVPVPLIGDDFIDKEKETIREEQNGGLRQIKIYEDLWFTKGDIIRNRLRALLGKGEVVFARKCRVAKIDVQMAREFLDNNHILGYSRAKYFYALFYSKKLVAVASFSASRTMKRDGRVVNSFEWVRYASLGSSRIVGGMGRLLSIFVEQEKPQEIMSYADLDWGGGNAYKKLGFKLIGKTAPLKFMIDPKTHQRHSLKKLLRDHKYNKECKYRDQELNDKQFILLLNSGNLKFLRSFTFL